MSGVLRVAVRRCALALLFAVPLIRNAEAADAVAADTVTLPPVVVTATRLPMPESEVASSITVITGEEIERKQERTLSDVLQDVPGLNVVQTGGPGGTTSVFMRGTNANHVKVFVDGIDASDPSSSNGTFNFEHFLTSDIERVEVLRGPQSGLYGANAIGGVINIITRKGSGPARVTGALEGGSFGTFNQNAGVSGEVSRFSYALDIAHFRSEDTPVTPSDLVPPGRNAKGNSYDNKTFATRIGADIADNLDVGLVARYIDTALHFTGDDFLGPETLTSEEDKRQLYTRGSGHLSLFDGRFDQTLGLAYTNFRQRDLDPNFTPADPSFFRGERVKLDWQGNVRVIEGQVLTLGAEHQLDEVDSDGPVDASMTNDAGFLQLQSSLGGQFFNTASLRFDGNDRFGSKATYRVAPAFLIPKTDTKLKGSVGTGFNPPTLSDLFQSFPDFGFFANPDLKPETSIGYDLGFEQGLFEKEVQLGVTWFHNDIDNLISINDTGTTLVNIGKAVTYGTESFIAYKPWETLTLRGDYTYTIAQDDILHRQLLRRPRNKLSLDTAWRATDDVTLSATVLYVGPWFDVNRSGSESNIPANGYTTVNIAGSYALGHGLTAFARIDNLLDRHYQDPLGFQRPGLGVFGGLRFAFNAADLGK